jgi:predicted ester cyclase
MSAVEENKAVARLYCLGDPTRGLTNVEVWDEICDPAVSLVGTPGFPEIHGVENFKKIAGRLRSAFSDIEATIEEMIAEGDKVVVRWSATATSNAPVTLYGVEIPAGKSITRAGVSILRFRSGKVGTNDPADTGPRQIASTATSGA